MGSNSHDFPNLWKRYPANDSFFLISRFLKVRTKYGVILNLAVLLHGTTPILSPTFGSE